jgi:molybdopterin synthase sulfur carrier subunit
MPVTVNTGASLKSLLSGQSKVSVEGSTVVEVIRNLDLADRILDEQGKLRRHFNIHLNHTDDIRFHQGVDTPLKDGDALTIISAISGG